VVFLFFNLIKKKGACFSYTPFSCCLFYTSVKLCFITQKQRVVVLLLPSINESVLLSLLFYFIFTLSYFIFTHTYIYTQSIYYISPLRTPLFFFFHIFFFSALVNVKFSPKKFSDILLCAMLENFLTFQKCQVKKFSDLALSKGQNFFFLTFNFERSANLLRWHFCHISKFGHPIFFWLFCLGPIVRF
jgi:hypothetical protein